MSGFGQFLRQKRIGAGIGLRSFASLIGQRASITSAIETGRRSPWRREEQLQRAASVLGLDENQAEKDQFFQLARDPSSRISGQPEGHWAQASVDYQVHGQPPVADGPSRLLAWWTSEDALPLDNPALVELASFVGAVSASLVEAAFAPDSVGDVMLPILTELEIEWRVRDVLGRRGGPMAAAPVDVEAVLENSADISLEIVPGLAPRFSVQACMLSCGDHLKMVVDRTISDSRPMSLYRLLLASCYAPVALWGEGTGGPLDASWYQAVRASHSWPRVARDCELFALAMLLPAGPVSAAAESAFTETVGQLGWVAPTVAMRIVRNRLAEQFAVPPELVGRRLSDWPCHVEDRIRLALKAQESTLPPSDWFNDDRTWRQQTLFDVSKRLPNS